MKIVGISMKCMLAKSIWDLRFLTSLFQEVRRNHKKWLAENRHMKYLWIPYTDSVVIVKNNPVPEVRSAHPWASTVLRDIPNESNCFKD